MKKYLLLIFGVFCCSTSVIFIKISHTDAIALSAWRTIIAAFLLLPFAWKAYLKHRDLFSRKTLFFQILPPAVFLAIHFISWILGARMTPAANASLIVNMVPVVMPFLLYFSIKERLNRFEIVGTILALSGVGILGMNDFNMSKEYAIGDAVCFVSMLFYASYLLFARKHKSIPSIYLYVVPVYFLSGVICLVTAAFTHFTISPIQWIGPNLLNEWVAILGLAIVPTVLGHSLINWALKVIRGQQVVIINLSQFIFAGIMGFFLLNEIPAFSFYITACLIILGAIIVIKHTPSSSQ